VDAVLQGPPAREEMRQIRPAVKRMHRGLF
jgi:hypothetical protein